MFLFDHIYIFNTHELVSLSLEGDELKQKKKSSGWEQVPFTPQDGTVKKNETIL